MALPELLLLFQWGRDGEQPLLSQHVAMAQQGCEKPWLHRHGIQRCSLPPQRDQYLHKYHPATAKGIFLVLTNFGKGCCSADGKNEFSLPANGNFTLKCVFADASQLFDAELVTQQDRPVLAVKRPFPLLETTFSFPCGRQHSPQCSAAVGALVLPLQSSPHSDLPLWLMSLLLDLSCSLNLFSAYFAAFLSFHQ